MVMLRAWVWADSKMIVWLCMCCAGYLGEQNDEQMTTGWQMFVASSASNQQMSPGPDQQMAEGGSPVLKILSRISVGGISMVSGVVWCRCRCRAVVDGSLDLSARSTCFFI
jgi:hypothetical protein